MTAIDFDALTDFIDERNDLAARVVELEITNEALRKIIADSNFANVVAENKAAAKRIADLEAQRPHIMAPGEMGGAVIELNEHLRLAQQRIAELESQLAAVPRWTRVTADPESWPPDEAEILTASPIASPEWDYRVRWLSPGTSITFWYWLPITPPQEAERE